jgi:acetolactate synthase-1/2/3 large subunit
VTVTVAHQVVDALARAGVSHVFGVVGTTTLPFLDVLHDRSDVAYVSVRHEQVGASAADGYARMTRRPGVVLVQGGSGVTNLLLSVCIAWKDSVPLLILSGLQPQAKLGRDSWQEIDAVPIFRTVTKWAYRVTRPDEVPWALHRALVTATSDRPGPVLLEIPRDVSTRPAVGDVPHRPDGGPVAVPWARPAPRAADVQAVARALGEARRPLLLLGGGVLWAGAVASARALVEASGLPALATDTARGVVPEDHPACLGFPGRLGDKTADAALRDADCVVAVGARFTDITTSDWTLPTPGARVFQVNVDGAALGAQMPVTLGLLADAGLFLDALRAALGDRPLPAAAWGRERHADFAAERASHLDETPETLSPEALLAGLARRLRRDALLTVGAGTHTRYFNKLLVREAPGNLQSAALGSMCFAFPAALGAKLVAPSRQVVCLVGDGDFGMVMQDLETVARLGLQLVTVVYDNGAYGQKVIQHKDYGARYLGVDFTNPDFGAYARLFGLTGERVARGPELAPALDRVFSATTSAVLDVELDPLALPRGMEL